MLMAYRHNGWDIRCPFCLSKKLKVIDNGIADPKYHERYGKIWHLMECKNCGGVCQDISNFETKDELIAKAEARRLAREGHSEEVSD